MTPSPTAYAPTCLQCSAAARYKSRTLPRIVMAATSYADKGLLAVKQFLTKSLPKWLKSLPLPSTFAGFSKLTRDQWIQLLPILSTLCILFILTTSLFETNKKPRINTTIKVKEEKVVDKCPLKDIEDSDKEITAFCRCWKSKKFPYCDGCHVAHNKATGDNVGPLLITQPPKKPAAKK